MKNTSRFSDVRRPVTPERRATIDAVKRGMATVEKAARKADRALGEGLGPTGGYVVPKGNTIIKKPKKKK